MSQANVIHGKTWTATGNGEDFDAALPQTLPSPLWSRLRSVFTWKDLIVAGKHVKGFVVSPAIAAVVLGAILTAVGAVYWRMSDRVESQNKLLQDQKELIIRLDQRLIDKNERDREYRDDMKKSLEDYKLIVDSQFVVTNKRLANLEE